METTQIEEYPVLIAYLKKNKDPLAEKIIDTIFLCGQGNIFFKHLDSLANPDEKLDKLIETLKPVEAFYDVLGGLRAYHNEFMWLLDEKRTKIKVSQFLLPHTIDITKANSAVNRAVRKAIENIEIMAEMYPIGGAGDRFNLTDPDTDEQLPVAALLFCGHTLLEGMIRDLQAREYLCYKLRGLQVLTPIALMTSHEKQNHMRVTQILENCNWFHRGKDSFRLFIQPLVPVISEDGVWVQTAPLTLCMKPGGHGVIWKIAHDEGIFSWFEETKRTKAIIRQINNPIAGTDYGLLAFTGLGIDRKKLFGFASCHRVINSAEGMNAVVENYYPSVKSYEYSLSNIEYTNLEQEGIKDLPDRPGSRYSAYPCNTNILFIDLPTIDKLSIQFPLPGLLVNLKHSYPVLQPDGSFVEKKGARIETTMQNISDHLTYTSALPLENQNLLSQFITYNERKKTISVTKQQYTEGDCLDNTPEGALRDLLSNYRDLLTTHCAFVLSPEESVKEFIKTGPSFYFNFHPAMGPLYSIIGQKIRKGKLGLGAELILEAAEIKIDNLTLDGSLLIQTKAPCGHFNENELLEYSNNGGKCSLVNVTVLNKGIDKENTPCFWSGTPTRLEQCLIEIEGNGEFHAENVTLQGNKQFSVPHGHRLEVTANGESLKKIETPTWWWEYSFRADDSIQVTEKTASSTGK